MNNFLCKLEELNNLNLEENIFVLERDDIDSKEIIFYKLTYNNEKIIIELEDCKVIDIDKRLVIELNNEQYNFINKINEEIKNKFEIFINNKSSIYLQDNIKFNSLIKNKINLCIMLKNSEEFKK